VRNLLPHSAKRNTVPDLRFPRRCVWRLLPSGKWRLVVLKIVTSVCEEPAPTFSSLERLFYRITQRHTPEVEDNFSRQIVVLVKECAAMYGSWRFIAVLRRVFLISNEPSALRSYRNYFTSTGQETAVHVHSHNFLLLKHVKLTETLNTIKLT
jgi:hypothetical protein